MATGYFGADSAVVALPALTPKERRFDPWLEHYFSFL